MDNIANHKAKVLLKIMTLSLRDYRIIKVVKASELQGGVRYGISRGIQ